MELALVVEIVFIVGFGGHYKEISILLLLLLLGDAAADILLVEAHHIEILGHKFELLALS